MFIIKLFFTVTLCVIQISHIEIHIMSLIRFVVFTLLWLKLSLNKNIFVFYGEVLAVSKY